MPSESEEGLRSLIDLAVLSAKGEEDGIRQSLRSLETEGLSLSEVHEIFLQTALFAGVPRCLNAFRVLRNLLNAMDDTLKKSLIKTLQDERVEKEVRLSGKDVFESVYQEKANDIREILRRQDEVLEKWIIESAYEKILGRPQLSLKKRGLCAVAVLIVLDLPVQLFGHMKGALANGATSQDVELALEVAHKHGGSVSHAREILEKLK